MSAEEMKSLISRFFDEIANKGNLDAVDEMCTPDFEGHGFPGEMPSGCDGIKQTFTLLRMGLPDLNINIDDMTVEGDKVTVQLTGTGKHTEEVLGVEPTGLKVTVSGTCIYRIADGKIAEGWFKP